MASNKPLVIIVTVSTMITFCLSARMQPYSPLINGFVNDALGDACPSVNKVLLQASGITNECLVHTLLHHSPKFDSQSGSDDDCLVIGGLA